MITGYIEIATEKEASDLETEIGEKYAASVGKDWPMPPDVVGPGQFPCGLLVATPFADLTPEQQSQVIKQTYYVRALRHDDGIGGVLIVDDTIDKIPDVPEKVSKEELSAKAQALLDEKAPADPKGEEDPTGEVVAADVR